MMRLMKAKTGLAIGVVGSLLLLWVVAAWAQTETPPPPLGAVKVVDVDLTGLTQDEARSKLAEALDSRLDAMISLTDGAKRVELSRRALGAALDLDAMIESAAAGTAWTPLKLTVDVEVAKAAFEELTDTFAFPGLDAKVVDQGGRVYVDPGQMRRNIVVPTSAARFAAQVAEDAATTSFHITVAKNPQNVTADVFAGINARLARFSTSFNPRVIGRTENMKLAAATIDGLLIPPGAVFSLNEAVGPRTAARGFREAIIFVDGKEEKGLGGGVSQITGTLFNTALLAGLKIVTYRTHSKPVVYLPVGRDATVAWGQFDMKFENNTATPIFIRYVLSGTQLVCTMYGAEPPERKISLSVTRKDIGPRRIDASLYRLWTRDGKTTREHIGNSRYDWKPNDPE